MKFNKIIYAAVIAFSAAACVSAPVVEFDVDADQIKMGSVGGSHTIKVASSGEWVAMTESPWITVSPANGRGSVECNVIVDSALLVESRTGYVRIQELDSDQKKDFTVVQDGFEYQIVVDKPEVEVADFEDFSSRHFEMTVTSNVDFEVIVPEGVIWLSPKKEELVLDRGARPRKSKVRFDWTVNSLDQERVAEVQFRPVENVAMGRHDALKVVQKAAPEIPENTPAGDSLALLSISRALNCNTGWDPAERMEHWHNVKVWKDGPNKGRVRYVQFFMFKTQEEIPFAVRYLTAAEEIVIYSNANHFLRRLDTGDHITKLTDLKRLTIGAYGLVSLHPDFVNLKNLEFLNISSNCFEYVPEILTPENFPNLRALVMNANQRYTIYDLSNDTREDVGGFIEDDLATSKGMESFKRLLKWNNLDTLVLSVNYLQGEIPDMKNEGLPEWTFEELKDSLATGITSMPEQLKGLPKVLPNAERFSINFNRFTGNLPDWLLYHPNLDLWMPGSLVFPQEGKTRGGINAGFANEPTSLDYYYQLYVNKKYNPNKSEDDK